MIYIKSQQQIENMRLSGKILSEALKKAGSILKPGITTGEIDNVIHRYIVSNNAVPSFLNYSGFPKSSCISVNEELIHGIPSDEKLIKDGDIVSIDVGVLFGGMHTDCARTFLVGNVSPEAIRLEEITRKSFFEGLRYAKKGFRLGDICSAIGSFIEKNGCFVVKDYVGHGVGVLLHEEPSVPNFGTAGHGIRLMPGMTLAIEPMVNSGTEKIKVLENGWTVVTLDNNLSAHYENTILITDGEPELLTAG